MYKIICDRCGEEYGQYSELYQLERGRYRINRYAHEPGADFGDYQTQHICLCPTCEEILDAWMGIGLPDSFKHAAVRGESRPKAADMLKDEDFGLPKRIDSND